MYCYTPTYYFGTEPQKTGAEKNLTYKKSEKKARRKFKYKYNGKELQDELNLNLYAMDMRQYDPAIARWTSTDPITHYSQSNYTAFDNNPIFWADPSGADSWHYDWDLNDGTYVNDQTGETTTDWQRAVSETQANTNNKQRKKLRKVTYTISGKPNGKKYYARTYPSRDGNLYEVPVYTLTVRGTDNQGNEIIRTFDILRFMPYLNRKKDNTGYKTITETPFMSGLADYRKAPIQRYNANYEIHNTYSPENGGFVILGSFMIHDGPDDITSDIGWGGAGCMEVCGNNGFADLKSLTYALSGSQKTQDKALNDLVNAGLLIVIIEKAVRPTIKKVN